MSDSLNRDRVSSPAFRLLERRYLRTLPARFLALALILLASACGGEDIYEPGGGDGWGGGDDDIVGGGDDDTAGGDDDDSGGGGHATDDDDSSISDDDDATGSDDDSSGDDDDTSGNDDDTSGDDDDTSGDDDATSGDDDDTTGVTYMLFSAPDGLSFPDLTLSNSAPLALEIYNGGTDIVYWALEKGSVTPTPSALAVVFAFTGGSNSNGVATSGSTTERELTFTPELATAYTAVIRLQHSGINQDGSSGAGSDGDWTTYGDNNPAVLTFTGNGVGTSESDCSDGIDNDADLLIDCDDTADCSTDPSCGGEICTGGVDEDSDSFIDCDDTDCDFDPNCRDFCCDAGDSATYTLCLQATALQCVCTGSADCCAGAPDGLWSGPNTDTSTCAGQYINCGATCPYTL